MPRNLKLYLLTIVIFLIASLTVSAAGSWNKPLAQMDMATGTPTPQPQTTATPAVVNTELPSPTWTSIFTGYTPAPNTTAFPMGGFGMGAGASCLGMSGSSMGTGGMGNGSMMGASGMGSTGTITGTMDMGDCPMMSGMVGMSGMSMGGNSSMAGMNMDRGYMIDGMDLNNTASYVDPTSTNIFSNPWLLLGWVLLGSLIIVILVGLAAVIIWLIRRSKPAQAA